MRFRSTWPLCLAAAFVLSAPGAAPAAAEAERTLLPGPSAEHRQPLGGRAEVEVRMDRGKLVVRGGAAGEARARATLGGQVAGLEVKHEGNWLRYEVKPAEAPPGTPMELDSQLEIDLPAGSDLTVEGPAVDIVVEGLTGKIDLRTLSGAVRLDGQPAQVEVQTISGPITTQASFACALTVLRSVAGALELAGRFEELNARTADSRLRVTATISDEALLESGNGLVSFAGELSPVARLRVNTLGGEARLELPRELEGHFLVSSFEGELENGLGPGFARSGLRRSSSWQRGEAPRRVEVETFYGKIAVLPR